MYKKNLLLIVVFLFALDVYADKIFLEDGQILDGIVQNQFGDFISVDTDSGVISVHKDDILSVQKRSIKKNSVSELDNKPQSNKFNRKRIRNLDSLVKIYKADILHLESEISLIEQKYLDKIKKLQLRIKKLESELKNRQIDKDRFKELILIDKTKDILLNLEYVEKVRFRVTQDYDGYFVGAEYQIFSDFVTVQPHFEVYFFNKDGLNIGKSVIEWKFSKIPPQERESIIKGTTMDIGNSMPEYFYIKILKD